MYRQSIKTIAIIVSLCLINLPLLKAQDNHKKTYPVQITLVTPIGSNGAASDSIANNFSLNLLWGVTGGVAGAEFGGLWNKTNGAVSGVQFAGLGNAVSGKVIGAQFAGLLNFSSTSFVGLQSAGLANIIRKGEADNETETPSNPARGVQISGLLNINSRPITGLQAAGLLNSQTDSLIGMQIAGLMNASPSVQGVQVAGLFNKTSILSGVQIGLINIADTVKKGIQIGLINIVKNGYRTAEVEYNETFYATVNYKMGTRSFYSIFSLAFKERNGKRFWAHGFGFGTLFPINPKIDFNIDAISYQVNEDEWWTNELNTLNKLKLTGAYQISRNFTVYGGASLNVFLSGIKDAEGKPGGSILKTPNPFLEEVHHNTLIMIYPGFHAGIRF